MLEIKLPDLGEGIAEGELVTWHVKVGDTVVENQPLLDILTDKASIEVPAPQAGVVQQLLAQPGELVPVGQVVAVLGTTASSVATIKSEANRIPVMSSVPVVPSQLPLATPSIRQQARELGIDLTQVSGSGPYGRIVRADLEAQPVVTHLAQVNQAVPTPSPDTPGMDTKSCVHTEERIPLRGIRRKIAAQMVKSKFTAPDFMYADELDITELVAWRKELNEHVKSQGIKLTYLPFIIKAVISALKRYPTLNASLEEDEIVLKKYYHIGIATSTEQGLMVPVIKDADQLSLVELAQEISRLAEVTRAGKAKNHELMGSTFTLTNIGVIGGTMCVPIINYPEVAILGINKIYQKPMVYQGEIAIRWSTTLSLSFDHRVVDGSDGALFTRHIMQLLENPKLLLLEGV